MKEIFQAGAKLMIPRNVEWRKFGLMLVLCAASAICLTSAAGTVYVDNGLQSYTGHDGTSWAMAFKTIQEGVNAAADGDTVLVAPGVAFKDPVWMDMITGRVYEIDAKDFETRDGTTIFTRLPLWDSPILIAERGQVELSDSSF